MEVEQSSEEIVAEFTQSQEEPKDGATSQEAAKDGQPPAAAPQLYKYKTDGGKEVEEPIDMILKRASMGYHYAQRMADVNRQMEQFKKVEEQNKSLSRWKEYDEYAQKNPKWNDHVQQMWDAREKALQGQLPDDIDPRLLSALEAKLEAKYGEKFQKYDQHFETTEKERALEKQYLEDGELDQEVQKVRKEYPDIDFDKADEMGNSLEKRICDFGAKRNLGTFSDAFHLFYRDQLLTREREKAKEALVKEKQENEKKGIVGKSQIPLMNGKSSTPKNLRNRSYEDISAEIKAELNS
jgi:hypothetical protein